MKERPILFSAPMIRALLAGTKTQTRRVAKWKPREPGLNLAFSGLDAGLYHCGRPDAGWVLRSRGAGGCWNDRTHPLICPYGSPGDRLWVRETWQAIHVSIDPETGYGDDVRAADKIPSDSQHGYWGVAYAATDPQANEHRDDRGFVWRPSIHMPRWASRITLEVTGVRVERLHAITRDDAIAEGIPQTAGEAHDLGLIDLDKRHGYEWDNRTSVENFAALWDSINGKPRPMLNDDGEPVLDDSERPIMIAPQSWDANPWVWVVEFRRVDNQSA